MNLYEVLNVRLLLACQFISCLFEFGSTKIIKYKYIPLNDHRCAMDFYFVGGLKGYKDNQFLFRV